MLTNIINQIQQERDQDRHISKRTGTNQIHDFTRIPGHRKVAPNAVLGKVSAFIPTAVVAPPAPAPAREIIPAPEPAPEPTPEPAPAPEPAVIETNVQQPTRLSKTAMKKKQKEEEQAKKREAQAKAEAEAKAQEPAQEPAPEPIEIESTVSE